MDDAGADAGDEAKREGLPAPDKVVNLLDMQGLSTRVLSRASMSIFRPRRRH